jgi:hypothetical protein
MTAMIVRLFSMTQTPACVMLSLEPAPQAGHDAYYVREATGLVPNKLTGGTVYGPFAKAEALSALEQLQLAYVARGYLERKRRDYLQALLQTDRKARARAAIQVGWRKPVGALEALLKAAAEATTEISSVVDALARLSDQDPRVIAVASEQAQKKLLSRRRSGVEALRVLNDASGIATAFESGLARLNSELTQLLSQMNHSDLNNLPLLKSKLQSLSAPELGLTLDQLYEFDTQLAMAAVRELAFENALKPGRFRYTKSIFKRALLRNDAWMLAKLTRLFELTRTPAITTSIKSGLDGQSRQSSIYSQRTRAWLIRASARHLRRLGNFDPKHYLTCATALLAELKLDAKFGAQVFDSAVVAHSLLYSASQLRTGKRRLGGYALAKAAMVQSARVPFASIWQQHPDAWVGLLAVCEFPALREGIEFDLRAQPELIGKLNGQTLALLFDVASVRELAGIETTRRFNPANPDLALCGALLDGNAFAQSVAVALLRDSSSAWAQNPNAIQDLLTRTGTDAQQKAADAVIAALAGQITSARAPVLLKMLEALPFESLEAHAGRLSVITHFASDYPQALSVEHLLAMLDLPQAAPQTAAVAILASMPEGANHIGVERCLRLADSSIAGVRRFALILIESSLHTIAQEPYGLLRLADGRFPDARDGAFKLIQRIDFAQFGFDGILNLCDSNQAMVQKFARDWVRLNLARIDAATLLLRLQEHPHRTMQSFAIELLEHHLAPGAPALARVRAFLQACLRRPRMARIDKDRVLRVLRGRGALDAEQGAMAIAVLNDSLRTATRRDREPLLVALSELSLRYPKEASDWRMQIGAQGL